MTPPIVPVCLAPLLVSFVTSAALPQDWQVRTAPTNAHLYAITAGQNQIIAVGQGATVIRSLDGIHWTQAPFARPSDGALFSIAYGNGMFVAGGESNVFLVTSPDGMNWTVKRTASAGQKIYAVGFLRDRFVAVGQVGANESPSVLTSTNGVDWDTVPRPTSATLRAVAWGGQFTAVGDSATIIASSDDSNWTLQNSGTSRNLRAAVYSGRTLVAGDVGTVLQRDVSFDVRGLASGNSAVVAVGATARPVACTPPKTD